MSRTLSLVLAAAVVLFPGSATQAQSAPAPASVLLSAVDIPYEQFTLSNGLRVIVHTDRKAPIVAVSVWYDVGSKHEPLGKTGFAHLFEHLMFNGSENAPGDYFEPLQQVGATDFNGTTWFDRTNYFQTVPTSALEVALFLESDRMGHLLGAVTQEKLDNQRGVVQNEKRQGDNQPYGMVEYAQLAALLPPDHPYGHSTIGSMADLDAASLEDVKRWFTDHYGPNNAIVVLAGDIDARAARPLVEKYFGDIPRGKPAPRVTAPIPTLKEPKSEVIKDRVATTRLYRYWTVPGLNDGDSVPLGVGAAVLGGLASSRLDNLLVRQEQLAVRVTATVQNFAQLGFMEITADVKPGVDADKLSARLDQIVSEFIEQGPTADEVQRVSIRQISGVIGGLESVGGFGGKAGTLAEGELYSGDPQYYKKRLAATTPQAVKKAMQKWLKRPVYALRVVPGERDVYQEAGGKTGSRTGVVSAPAFYRSAEDIATLQPRAAIDRSKLPEVGSIPNVDFPAVETMTLSNGIKVNFARRAAIPAVQMSLVFNAGNAADPRDKLGTQSLMLAMLEEGTTTRNSIQIAEEQERLGASIQASASMDRTEVSMFAMVPNLGPSLDLLADIVKNPAFDAAELERMRALQLTRIAQENTQPQGIALRTLPTLLFGANHPYAVPFTGTGDPAVVAKLARDDLAAFHNKWIRADNVEIFVVGATSLAELKPMLEQRFGVWRMTRDLPGRKAFDAVIPAKVERIVLVDRPQSPQSMILAGQVMDRQGTDDLVPLQAANDVLGGNFLSRMNMDLRETKGWSYGVRGIVNRLEQRVPYLVMAPVQTDQTGPSIVALKTQMKEFMGARGVTPAELDRTIVGSVRELPGSYETSNAVLRQMQTDVLFKQPPNYAETLADRYRALDAKALDAAARASIDPDKFTWVVVGDKAKVLPQLQALGMPITVVDAAAPPR